MKTCPRCHRLYEPGAGYCQADGCGLVEVAGAAAPSDANDPRVGAVVLGRYRVFRVVADGGMGRVYEALDERTDAHVALKILHQEVASDPISLERFAREFQVNRELDHRHIVRVTDFASTEAGDRVLAMDYLVGEELRALLRRERTLMPARVIRMVSQAALALDYAHAGQWVHRDLKPDNLFLCQTQSGDIVKVLDFGSVKDTSGTAKQLTVMGTTIGSPYYMSPEQAQGLDTLDWRTDIWAMAVMIYECLTGTVPFSGPNGPSTLLQILAAEPAPPSSCAAGRVPLALDAVLARALAKAPEQRFASMGELADQLGWAYGLAADHRRWAELGEAELAAQIHLANVDCGPPAGTAPDSAVPVPPATPAAPETVRRPWAQQERPRASGVTAARPELPRLVWVVLGLVLLGGGCVVWFVGLR